MLLMLKNSPNDVLYNHDGNNYIDNSRMWHRRWQHASHDMKGRHSHRREMQGIPRDPSFPYAHFMQKIKNGFNNVGSTRSRTIWAKEEVSHAKDI